MRIHQALTTKAVHFHLHKTAGTSVNRWLETLFSAEAVRPADYDAQFFLSRIGEKRAYPQFSLNLPLEKELGRESRAYFNAIHGHSPGLIGKSPEFYCFTILRDPTTRFLSFVRDWRRLRPADIEGLHKEARTVRRDAKILDANEFIEAHADKPYFSGLSQAAMLSQAASIASGKGISLLKPDQQLPTALFALESLFNYVGVFEDLDSAVRCIARDLGAAPPADLGRANAGRADARRDELSPGALQKLREVWADDYILHDRARKLSQAFLSKASYDDGIFERQYLAERLTQLRPYRRDSGRYFSVNDQIVGSGFHGREAPNTANALAWTGPVCRSVLYVPVPPEEFLDFFIDVGGYIDPRVGNSVRLRIDGTDVTFRREPASNVLERLWTRVVSSRIFLKVEIFVDFTFSPAELGASPDDRRQLGLALRGYGFRLAPSGDGGSLSYTGVTVDPEVGGDPFDNTYHPDRDWAIDLGRLLLCHVSSEQTEETVLYAMTFGIDQDELIRPASLAGLTEAFRRVLRRPVPTDWIDYWVDKPHLTLRQLYLDLIRGEEFRQRRQRISTSAR